MTAATVKAGTWVTIDDKPVMIGGPGAGGGSAAPSIVGAYMGKPVYRGTTIPQEVLDSEDSIAMVGDGGILSMSSVGGNIMHADMWHAAGNPKDIDFDRSARVTFSHGRRITEDRLENELYAFTADFELGGGFSLSVGDAIDRMAPLAVRLIRAGVPEQMQLSLGVANSRQPIKLQLIEWSEGRKAVKACFFFMDDEGRTIFTGGPGAGGGTGQAALVGSAQGNPVYIGTGIPDAITVEGKGALLMVGDRQILSCVPNRHGMFFHATAWEAAGKPHDPGYDTSTRLTLGEATSKGRSLITGNFELGMGDYPTLEAQFNRLSTVAVRLIRAGLPEDTLLILSGNPSDKPGGISMPLSSWSAGKKEGRFVTIDDRPVFIGGPGSGGGSAAASGSGAPAGEPLQPLTPEAIDSGIDEVSKMTPKELYQTADTLYNDMLGEDWISADYEEADAKRQAAARALAEKYGLDADQTIAVSNTWVSTACDDNPLALGVQLAVAERLGLEPNAYLQEKLTTVTPAKVDPRIIDAFYTETQAQLAAAGVGPRMVLSRGIIVDRATAKRGWMTAELNPLSSFSTGGDDGLDKAFRFAQSFGDANSIGVIVQANIPTSRIIGWGFSGLGQIDEGEFIVAGGRAHLSIRQVVEGGP